MINVSIAGGTGYTAGELLRILLRHPEVNIESVISTTSVGMPVAEMHRDLLGETDLVFSDTFRQPDVLFLCLGHGLSRAFLNDNDILPHARSSILEMISAISGI
jgi:N-acetyl-gamma-glutamyl-phosphate reductase